jgi:hypothetical protein
MEKITKQEAELLALLLNMYIDGTPLTYENTGLPRSPRLTTVTRHLKNKGYLIKTDKEYKLTFTQND